MHFFTLTFLLISQIVSSHAGGSQLVLEAGSISNQVSYRASTEGIIEDLQEHFIQKGEKDFFHLV